MDITKKVARLRLGYHLNMIDVVNVANQLHLMSNNKADLANKNHLKALIDCYDRLGYMMPKEFIDFSREGL